MLEFYSDLLTIIQHALALEVIQILVLVQNYIDLGKGHTQFLAACTAAVSQRASSW